MKVYSLLLISMMIHFSLHDCTSDNGCDDDDIEPKCGTDGLTYINECQLEECPSSEGVQKAYEGVCRCNCAAQPVNKVCGADGVYYRNPCALICAGVPEGRNCNRSCDCNGFYEPVCGIDGRNYTSACLAGCHGIAIAYNYPCRT